jgi:hypothetical protein
MNVISVRRPDIVVYFAEGRENDLPVGVRALCVGVHTWVGLPTSLLVALARKWRPVIRTLNGKSQMQAMHSPHRPVGNVPLHELVRDCRVCFDSALDEGAASVAARPGIAL